MYHVSPNAYVCINREFNSNIRLIITRTTYPCNADIVFMSQAHTFVQAFLGITNILPGGFDGGGYSRAAGECCQRNGGRWIRPPSAICMTDACRKHAPPPHTPKSKPKPKPKRSLGKPPSSSSNRRLGADDAIANHPSSAPRPPPPPYDVAIILSGSLRANGEGPLRHFYESILGPALEADGAAWATFLCVPSAEEHALPASTLRSLRTVAVVAKDKSDFVVSKYHKKVGEMGSAGEMFLRFGDCYSAAAGYGYNRTFTHFIRARPDMLWHGSRMARLSELEPNSISLRARALFANLTRQDSVTTEAYSFYGDYKFYCHKRRDLCRSDVEMPPHHRCVLREYLLTVSTNSIY